MGADTSDCKGDFICFHSITAQTSATLRGTRLRRMKTDEISNTFGLRNIIAKNFR